MKIQDIFEYIAMLGFGIQSISTWWYIAKPKLLICI